MALYQVQWTDVQRYIEQHAVPRTSVWKRVRGLVACQGYDLRT